MDIEYGNSIYLNTIVARAVLERGDEELAKGFLDSAKKVWDNMNSDLWTGDHYKYARSWADYVWGVDVFIGIVHMDTLRGYLGMDRLVYLFRIDQHLWNGMLVDGINSRQWCNNTYTIYHHVPDNMTCGCRTCSITILTLHGTVRVLSTDSRSSYWRIVQGRYWQNFFNSDCWDSSNQLAKCTASDSSGSEPCTCRLIQGLVHYMFFYAHGESLIPMAWHAFHSGTTLSRQFRFDLEIMTLRVPFGYRIYYDDGSGFVAQDYDGYAILEVEYDENGNAINVRVDPNIPPTPPYVDMYMPQTEKKKTLIALKVEVVD
jgi:hypothetical protein